MQIGNMKVDPVKIGIALATLLTAVIHISLGELLLILNGLGYLVLWAALFLPIAAFAKWRGQIRWLFVGYTLLTIVLYFVFHPNGTWQEDGLGVATKFIEVLLLLLLIYDGQDQSSVNPES
jgi:hypothetical protein